MDDGPLNFALAIFGLSIAISGFVSWWTMRSPALPKLDAPPLPKIDPRSTAEHLKKYEAALAAKKREER